MELSAFILHRPFRASTMSNDITCYATQPDMADTCHVLKDGYLTVGDEAGIGVRSLKEMKIV